MIRKRHCVRVLRRELCGSGRPDLRAKVLHHRKNRDGGWSPFVLREGIPRDDLLWILDIAHALWPDWVYDVSEEWLKYYERHPREITPWPAASPR